MMIIDLIKIIIISINLKLKNILSLPHHNDDLKRYFQTEYKNHGKEAYEYWIHTNDLKYYS